MTAHLRDLIRTIPDYPRPGILFRDITTLLRDAGGFGEAVDLLVDRYRAMDIAVVAGIEARGFILGGALAHALGAGFVPVRKRGKLPGAARGVDYALEYGTDRVEVHLDAVGPGDRILLADDLVATGGTARAAASLLREAGGFVAEACFLVELPDLGGRALLEADAIPVHALVAFDGE